MNDSCDYSDFKFATQNNAERHCWAAYHLFVLLSSLIGDSLILAASVQSDAFKVNKLIVTVIQHIAVSDLVYSIIYTLPATVSLLANSWMLGNFMCFIQAYFGLYTYVTGMFLIAKLTAMKFLILKYPLCAANWSTKKVHQVGCSIWAFCVIWPVIMLSVDRDDVQFDYRIYSCDYQFEAGIWKTILPIVVIIYSIAPNIVIVSTTIPTLKYLAAARKSAKRVKGSVPRRGALTVVLTAIVYIIATLPFTALGVAKTFMEQECLGWLTNKVFQITNSLLFITIIANFYIYALTIKSFRRFLLSKVLSVIPASIRTLRDITSTSGSYRIT
jgi:hypothetical protein